MIKVMSFDILTLIKSCIFFKNLFLKDYIGLMTRITSLSILALLFIGLSSFHDLGREFDELTELSHFLFFIFTFFFFSNFIN